MELVLSIREYNYEKVYKVASICLIVLLMMILLPIGIIFGSELGGYITEKLISRNGTDDSQLVIGRGGISGSLLDIVRGAFPSHMNPDEPAYRLNALIPLVMMGMLVLMLLRIMARGKLNVQELILAAVLIYVFYAFLPGIQELITDLLGG